MNIVELSIFDRKKRRAIAETQYIYYPVSIVPVKYWAVEKQSLSVVAQTISQLCRLQPMSHAQLMKKLNMPAQWGHILEHELNVLLNGSMLRKTNDVMYETFSEDVQLQHVYKQGYMFFDEVRLTFFDYVHSEEIHFAYEQDAMFSLQPHTAFSEAYYEGATCEEQMKRAVKNYNELQSTYFIDGVRAEEVAIQNAVDEEIRIEKRPYSFVKTNHYLPLRLQLAPFTYTQDGELKQNVDVISPFTKQPSVLLKTIVTSQPEGEEALQWQIDIEEASFIPPQPFEELLSRIEGRLNGVRVSEAVFEYLQLAEQTLWQYEQGEPSFSAARAAAINSYNLALEATLQSIVMQIGSFEAPSQWKTAYKRKQLHRYIDEQFFDMQNILPQSITGKMKRIATSIVERGASSAVNIYGNRDYFALLLLYDRLHERRWLTKLQVAPHYIQKFEHVVSWRNDTGGHHSDVLLHMSNAQFSELLSKINDDVYAFIQFLEGK